MHGRCQLYKSQKTNEKKIMCRCGGHILPTVGRRKVPRVGRFFRLLAGMGAQVVGFRYGAIE